MLVIAPLSVFVGQESSFSVPNKMATAVEKSREATNVKLFGKWSYNELEVRSAGWIRLARGAPPDALNEHALGEALVSNLDIQNYSSGRNIHVNACFTSRSLSRRR